MSNTTYPSWTYSDTINISDTTYSITDTTVNSPWSITVDGTTPSVTLTDTIDWDNLKISSGNYDKGLKVEGDAEINGDLTVNGKSIMKSLEAIEERLAILNPNPELEERWQELRDLRNKYEQLEKELIEKEEMWDMLKK